MINIAVRPRVDLSMAIWQTGTLRRRALCLIHVVWESFQHPRHSRPESARLVPAVSKHGRLREVLTTNLKRRSVDLVPVTVS